jgi:diguanylate cyclase (GGDEF)-like protein
VAIKRSKLMAPVVVLLLTIGVIAAVWGLVGRAYASHRAELQVSALRLSLADLQSAPFNADPAAGGSAPMIRSQIAADELTISRGLTTHSQPGAPPALLIAGRSHLTGITPVVQRIYRLAVQPGGLASSRPASRVPTLQRDLTVRSDALSKVLIDIRGRDAARAELARKQIEFGTAGSLLLLLVAFAFFYFRAVIARVVVERLVAQNEALLEVSRAEAKTDALTTLGNRRALASDFADAIAEPSHGPELLLAMFDLNGFKQYNDSLGHASGDALLHRVGAQLGAAAALHSGTAYRMGGDEFCVLARCHPELAERLLDETSAALHASGDGWQVGCSRGAAWVPSEAASESDALKLADARMYANKASHSSATHRRATSGQHRAERFTPRAH